MTTDPIYLHPAGGEDEDDPAVTSGATVSQRADAADGSLAGRLRAVLTDEGERTREFPVPGRDGLVLVARAVRDRKQIDAGMSNARLILEATDRLLLRDEDGGTETIEGGWQGVADIMGASEESLGRVVTAVLDNPLRLDGFAEQLITWMMGRRSQIEQLLGE
jgi:hypothetical protein